MVAACAGQATALGGVDAVSPEERVLGWSGRTALLVDGLERTGGWHVDVGEVRPFAIGGLAASQLRVGAGHGPVGWLATTTVLRSPVGQELGLGLDACAWKSRRFGIACGVRHDRLRIDGFERSSAWRFCVDAVAVVGDAAIVGYSISAERSPGVPSGGADVCVHAATRNIAGLRVSGGVQIRRRGVLDTRVGLALLPVRAFAAGIGYDSVAGSVHGFMTVRARALALSAGASSHPVLGISQRIMLSWGRS